MGRVVAVNISEKKGTQKKNVHTARFIEEFGLEHDAHAGKWHRQVSLLSYEKIQDFKAKGAPVEDGAFGGNLIVEGIDFRSLPVGTRFQCNDVVLEMTQIGKECHSGCEIYKIMGDCIMPREGVFARVLRGGIISQGDELSVMEEPSGPIRPVVSTRIAKDEIFFGPGIAQLLTLIEECKSMKGACAQMNLSYTKGWAIVNKAEKILGYQILSRQHGGPAGGGTRLTEEGRSLLKRYYELDEELRTYANQTFERIFPDFAGLE